MRQLGSCYCSNRVVGDLRAVEEAGAASTSEVGTELLSHLSQREGSHPDLLLQQRLDDALRSRADHVGRAAAFKRLADRFGSADGSPFLAANNSASDGEELGSWLSKEGLLPAYKRIYHTEESDAQDGYAHELDIAMDGGAGAGGVSSSAPAITGKEFPRDLPSSHVQLLHGVLSPSALHQTLLGAAEHHTPASGLTSARYLGRPRVPFSSKQLKSSFEAFAVDPHAIVIPPTSVSKASSVAASAQIKTEPAMPSAYAAQPSASSAFVSAPAPPSAAIVPPIQPAIAPAVALVPAPAAAAVPALRLKLSTGVAGAASSSSSSASASELREQRIVQFVASMNYGPKEAAEWGKTICKPVFESFWQQLQGLSWPDWTLTNGNPFNFKIPNKANVDKAGLPGYYSVVTTPMDLSRVKENIDKGKYATADAFLADLRLIARNAQMYNCPDSWVPSRDRYLPPPEEVRAKRPLELGHGSVYRMAWEFDAQVSALEPAVRSAWQAAFDGQKRQVAEFVLRQIGQIA